MIKFEDIFNQLLTESRWRQVVDRYRQYWPAKAEHYVQYNQGQRFNSYDEVVDYFRNNVDGKYLEWLLKQSFTTQYNISSAFLVNLVQRFDLYANRNIIEQKDINQYKTYRELHEAVDVAERRAEEIKRKKALEKQMRAEGDVVYEDSRWKVVVPKTYQASCHYGMGTKWCTTSKSTDSHFKSYTQSGILFYVSDKTVKGRTKMYKFALYWGWKKHHNPAGSATYVKNPVKNIKGFDSEDSQINMTHILPLLPPQMVEAISNYYAKTVDSKNPRPSIKDNPEKLLPFIQTPDNVEKLRDYMMNRLRTDIEGKLSILTQPFNAKIIIDDEADNQFSFHFVDKDDTNKIIGDTLYQVQLFNEIDGGPVNPHTFVPKTRVEPYRLDIFIRNDVGEWNQTRGQGGQFSKYFIDDVMRVYKHREEDYDFAHNRAGQSEEDIQKIIDDYNHHIYKRVSMLALSDMSRRFWYDDSVDVSKSDIVWWQPTNSSSRIKLRYPPNRGSVTEKFMKAVQEKPGITLREFYPEYLGYPYRSGHNTQLFGSIRDSGIVRVEKGPRNQNKYYLGPNYDAWTQGRLKRYYFQYRDLNRVLGKK